MLKTHLNQCACLYFYFYYYFFQRFKKSQCFSPSCTACATAEASRKEMKTGENSLASLLKREKHSIQININIFRDFAIVLIWKAHRFKVHSNRAIKGVSSSCVPNERIWRLISIFPHG